MLRMVLLIAALGLALECGASTVLSMRCGVNLVTTGQFSYEVLYRCGEPVQQNVKTIYRSVNYRDVFGFPGDGRVHRGNLSPIVVPVQIEEWIYDFGSTRLRRRLLFEDGQLVEIEVLDRGGFATPP